MNFIKDNFELVETKGDWELYLNRPVYKQFMTFNGAYIVNTKTGENCGQYLELYCRLFDDQGNKLSEPLYEEDTYKIVTLEELNGK